MSNVHINRDDIIAYLKAVVSEVTEIALERLSSSDPLEIYGINSTMILALNNVLERNFSKLPRTLFFEYKTIDELANYFSKHHSDFFTRNTQAASKIDSLNPATSVEKISHLTLVESNPGNKIEPTISDEGWIGEFPLPPITPFHSVDEPMDIAIIGVAGRYPQANNLDEFWDLLAQGCDCITEVPESRWNHAALFSPDQSAENKLFAKWGGFIDNYDHFDNRFFNISPREAERLDPQERLFLQTAWHTFESAGYSKQQVSDKKVSVFVGAMWSLYQLHAAERCNMENLEAASSSFASIANRVSYFFNLRGPSLALDSMCSSSLSAIHLACQSLISGESEMALAGGVNICSHPAKYIHLCEGRFAATDGRCRAFGEGGSGYVPGEGVGAVLLKTLERAIADGDYIHAVIKATALNHGGKTNGYTVPNPVAQANVLHDALARSGVAAENISVIETHGTGTALGDPIEMSGLMSAYGEDLNPRSPCAIGSVKSNIGHLESAAAMAGLTKLILQMQHRTLVPSLHTEKLNSNIDWANIPFEVQTQTKPWKSRAGQPVYAALSAFGAGGTNGHLVLASYDMPTVSKVDSTQLLVLSAADEIALRDLCGNLATYLNRHQQLALVDIAFTLQTAREILPQRLVIRVDNTQDAIEKLNSFAQQNKLQDGLWRNGSDSDGFLQLLKGDAGQAFVRQLFSEKNWETIAQLWLRGAHIQWQDLHEGAKPQRIPLPGYPFSGKAFNLGAPVWLQAGTSAATKIEHQRLFTPAWKTPELIAASNLPSEGFILANATSLPLAEKLQQQLQQDCNWQGAIVNTDEKNIADIIASTQLTVKSSLGIIDTRLVDIDFAYQQTEADIITSLLAFKPLLASRCHLRYLHISCPAPLVQLQNAMVRSLAGEYKTIQTASLELSNAQSVQTKPLEQLWSAFENAGQYRLDSNGITQANWQSHDVSNEALEIEQDAYHIITGGTGGIGLVLAQWLLNRGAKHIVLCGRQAIPEASLWPALLQDKTTDKKLREKIQQLSALSGQVEYRVVDLSSASDLEQFIAQLSAQRKLGYVFHGAGIADHQSPVFLDKTENSIAEVFSPKVSGTKNLVSALQKYQPQRLVLFSSLAAACPRLAAGVVDYAAANAYLIAIAESASGVNVQSVLLPNWREVGLGETQSPHYFSLQLKTVSNAQGIELLEKALLTSAKVVMPLLVGEDFDIARLGSVENLAAPKVNTAIQPTVVVQPKAATRLEKDSSAISADRVINELKNLLAPVLGMSANEWPEKENFSNLGVDSVLLASLATRIEKWLSVPFAADILLAHPTLELLAGYLQKENSTQLSVVFGADVIEQPTDIIKTNLDTEKTVAEKVSALPTKNLHVNYQQTNHQHTNKSQYEPIAVVGMGCVFPDAENINEYWENLKRGHNAIREAPASRWDTSGIYSEEVAKGKAISKWGGFVENVEYFNAQDFKLPAEIGADADPLLRLALWSADAALRDAGISTEDANGLNAGVFIGSRVANYGERLTEHGRSSVLGLAQNFIAAHISHWLNFSGPALVLDSACSSSLLAIEMACQSLRNGDCDIALAGGSEYLLDERPYQMLSQAKALSPTGQCRTFDADANGFVPGEGAGTVVLKRLSQALIDGDRIYVVVNAGAVNNDGHTMGVTTPNPEAQKAVIRKALQKANFSAQDIGYVEAHGTGTRIGDPMELKALTHVYREFTEDKNFCAIGSVKSNMGHLLSAAGSASFIKVALSIYHRTLVPTLHCDTPNPRFAFSESPFYPSNEARPWPLQNQACRAGISAFGFGGTNVHLLLSDLHLQQAYQSVKRALPLLPRSGNYAWHARRDLTPVAQTEFELPRIANAFNLKRDH